MNVAPKPPTVAATPWAESADPVETGAPDINDAEDFEVSASVQARILRAHSALIIVILAAIVLAFTIAKPDNFMTAFNIRSIASDASVLLVLSMGQTLVIMTGGIDLSVGSILVFSSIITAKVLDHQGGLDAGLGGIAVASLAGLVSGALWGFVNGFLISKGKIPPLIVTLGSFGAALGLAQVITNGSDLRNIPSGLTTSVGYGQTIGTIPWLVVIAVVVTAIGAFVVRTTRFGQYTVAIGSNAEGARRSSINVDRHLIKVYVWSGVLASLAGFLTLAKFGTTTISGHSTDNLSSIAAVVIGGTSLFGGRGSVIGTAVGVFIPVVLANGFVVVGIPPFWQSVAVGVVLVAAVYVDQLRRRSQQRG